MKQEVQSAVDFVRSLLKSKVKPEEASKFAESFENVLCSHYNDHWFPEKPFKGSGYRCMRIVNHKMDPLIMRAGANCGYSETHLLSLLPTELTLWVDPAEVSYRIGEEGSIGVLMEGPKHEAQAVSDCESDSSASSGSLSSSPGPQDYVFQAHHDQYYHPQQQYVLRAASPLTDPSFSHHWNEYLSTFVAS